MHHVVCAQVVDRRNAGFARQQAAIAQLHRERPVRAMQHGLAMKADDVDIGRPQAVLFKESTNRLDVPEGEFAFQFGKIARPFVTHGYRLRRLQRSGQSAAKCRIIAEGACGTAFHLSFAIGAQQRDIDTVHRGAAHQSDGDERPLRRRDGRLAGGVILRHERASLLIPRR